MAEDNDINEEEQRARRLALLLKDVCRSEPTAPPAGFSQAVMRDVRAAAQAADRKPFLQGLDRYAGDSEYFRLAMRFASAATFAAFAAVIWGSSLVHDTSLLEGDATASIINSDNPILWLSIIGS